MDGTYQSDMEQRELEEFCAIEERILRELEEPDLQEEEPEDDPSAPDMQPSGPWTGHSGLPTMESFLTRGAAHPMRNEPVSHIPSPHDRSPALSRHHASPTSYHASPSPAGLCFNDEENWDEPQSSTHNSPAHTVQKGPNSVMVATFHPSAPPPRHARGPSLGGSLPHTSASLKPQHPPPPPNYPPPPESAPQRLSTVGTPPPESREKAGALAQFQRDMEEKRALVDQQAEETLQMLACECASYRREKAMLQNERSALAMARRHLDSERNALSQWRENESRKIEEEKMDELRKLRRERQLTQQHTKANLKKLDEEREKRIECENAIARLREEAQQSIVKHKAILKRHLARIEQLVAENESLKRELQASEQLRQQNLWQSTQPASSQTHSSTSSPETHTHTPPHTHSHPHTSPSSPHTTTTTSSYLSPLSLAHAPTSPSPPASPNPQHTYIQQAHTHTSRLPHRRSSTPSARPVSAHIPHTHTQGHAQGHTQTHTQRSQSVTRVRGERSNSVNISSPPMVGVTSVSASPPKTQSHGGHQGQGQGQHAHAHAHAHTQQSSKGGGAGGANREHVWEDPPVPRSPRAEGDILLRETPTKEKVERVYQSGRKVVLFQDGTRKEVSSDGQHTVVFFANQDIKQVYPDGRCVYHYHEVHTAHTTYPDGLEVYVFPNRQIEKHFPDKSKQIIFPDGTTKTISPSGEERSVFPDGTVQEITTQGDRIVRFSNGQREIHSADGIKRREFPDGSIRIAYPDGRQETRYPSGHIRIKDAQGNIIKSTLPSSSRPLGKPQ